MDHGYDGGLINGRAVEVLGLEVEDVYEEVRMRDDGSLGLLHGVRMS